MKTSSLVLMALYVLASILVPILTYTVGANTFHLGGNASSILALGAALSLTTLLMFLGGKIPMAMKGNNRPL